jgi:hypothetical protein
MSAAAAVTAKDEMKRQISLPAVKLEMAES